MGVFVPNKVTHVPSIQELAVMQKSNCRKNKSRQSDFFLQLDDCSHNTNVANFQSTEILNTMGCERIHLFVFYPADVTSPEMYAVRKDKASNTAECSFNAVWLGTATMTAHNG